MRHKKKRNKLSRDSAHREALLSNLSKQLIEHERIQTSQAKAKAVKPEVEKLITLAKRGDLHAPPRAPPPAPRPPPRTPPPPTTNAHSSVDRLWGGGAPAPRAPPRRLHPHRQA